MKILQSQIGQLLNNSNMELGPILLQNALIVVLPELLGGILPRDPLENLRSTGMVVDELGHVVDVVVDDDVQALFGGFVGGDLRGGEGLGHDGLFNIRIRGLGFLSFSDRKSVV